MNTNSSDPNVIALEDNDIIRTYGECSLSKRQLVTCALEYEKRVIGDDK